ncbi:NADPH-dependent FMN reductase [Rothia sp. CCM 9417]|uniref:NADPH-dependent FMN reductase n=1 Tax=unclassified Rothia (in: high G+C Gram-positive bacteria) TaxID=2689056 RepID=UPI003AE7E0CA
MSAKILIISGSDRTGSFNTQLAEQFAQTAQARGLEAEVYNYSHIPLLSQNDEFPTRAIIAQLRADIKQADGLLIVSPEYNGAYPARLKNLIDWASRPDPAEAPGTPTVLAGKKVGIASVANSSYGKFALKSLEHLINFVGADLMDSQGLGIRIPREARAEGKLILDWEQQQKADTFIANYLAFIHQG